MMMKNDATGRPVRDPLSSLSADERRIWARSVLRNRDAIAAGLAVSGPWMLRRAREILGRRDAA